MSIGFEKFPGRYTREGGVPAVSITSRGLFTLNRLAFKELGEPEYVVLSYAPNETLIGFQGTSPEDSDAYKVRHPDNSSRQVEGRSFLKHYNVLEDRKGKRYTATMQDGILTIDLKEHA